MSVLPTYMTVHHMLAGCLWASAEDVGSLGTGVINDCEPICGFWKLDSGPLKERVLSVAGPSLQSVYRPSV